MAKKSLSYSQKLMLVLICASMAWVTWSYVLASLGKDPVENLAIAIVSTLILGLLAYFVKSFGEKNSRNKYKVDENGTPYELEGVSNGYESDSEYNDSNSFDYSINSDVEKRV